MGTTRSKRIERLGEAVAMRGVLRLREAARLLDVSEMTVRRDVATHADRFAYLGGHIVNAADLGAGSGAGSYVLSREADSHAKAKRAACLHALPLVRPDETIFIDCGTTLVHLAKAIPPDMPLTAVCYSLNVADPLRARPNVRLVLLGGVYQPGSDSFAGEDSLETLGRIGLDAAFVSAGGIHAERGVSCSHFHEVAYKKRAMAGAARRYLVADESKLGRVRPALFAQLDAFDAVVTETGVCSPAECMAERETA
ncbi:DeoR/GlpR family DNA-binding transcription regulator [Aureimonas leprariae]|uniref:DeoR/GlpR transcriptional regulator n=1 Tax=Plantimonas leprariae TaxID=2615207 RepID=A0A7V7TYK5_9HYPH|nr:DeoR/GlpR family DNA-binding transcription regulator [Aureimonas leprariae]KAB0677401.1 DeoR/GlpR transcriptional regulator [Aureimonas leprariae]